MTFLSMIRSLKLIFANALFLFPTAGFGSAVFLADTYTAQSTIDDPTPQRVEFGTSLAQIPFVFALTSDNGSDPALVRIFDVDATGFSSLIIEPDGRDGPHASMPNVSFIAIVPGQTTLSNGAVLTAGSIQTSQAVGGTLFTGQSYDGVNFGEAYANAPALITGLQSNNSNPSFNASTAAIPFLSTAVNNLSGSGFDVAIERMETATGPVQAGVLPEQIAWLAVERGTGTFEDAMGNSISYDFDNHIDAVDGWNNGGETVDFDQIFAQEPVGVAAMTSRNGNNGGILRRGEVDEDGVVLYIDEDTTTDSERGHIDEDVSTVFFSQSFVVEETPAVPEPSISFLAAACGLLLMSRRRRS